MGLRFHYSWTRYKTGVLISNRYIVTAAENTDFPEPRGCSQMTSAFFWVSYTPWCLCHLLAYPFLLQIDDVICAVDRPEPKTIIHHSFAPKAVQCGLFWMDSLESLDFSSFIIFSDDPWSLLVSFRQLFKLPLVIQCCDVICEWPLMPSNLKSKQFNVYCEFCSVIGSTFI